MHEHEDHQQYWMLVDEDLQQEYYWMLEDEGGLLDLPCLFVATLSRDRKKGRKQIQRMTEIKEKRKSSPGKKSLEHVL